MAVRRVEIRLTSSGFDKAELAIDRLNEKLDKMILKFNKLGLLRASPKVNIDGLAEDNAKLDKLNAKLDDLGRKRVTAKVGVDADTGSLSRFQNWLGKSFGLKPEPGGAGRKDGFFSRFLFDWFGWMGKTGAGGGAGGAAGGAAGGGGGIPAGVGLGIGALAIGSLLPALVPLLLGAIVGGGGAFGAYKLDPKAFSKVGKDISAAFMDALTQRGSSFTTPGRRDFGNLGGRDIQAPSFLQGIQGILKGIDQFIKQVGPQLGEMFRASLPFLNLFVSAMEYFGKLVLPIITQSLKSFAPYLPIISAGFQALAQGVAYFIKDLGPGMKDAAIIFRAAAIVIKGVLIAIAYVADALAFLFVKNAEAVKLFAINVRRWFDEARHWIAVTFDKIRHDAAHWVNDLKHDFDKVVNNIMSWAHDVAHWFDVARHDVAHIFDVMRHDIAVIWDTIWNNTIGRIIRGAGDVKKWFTTMKTDIGNVLKDLPHTLWTIGKNIIDNFVSGLKAAAGPLVTFVNWVSGLLSGIGSFFGLGGSHAPAAGLHMPAGVKAPALGLSIQAPAATAPAYAGPSGPLMVAINFNGIQGNPDAIAQQVHQVLRDYKKHRGNMALGLA